MGKFKNLWNIVVNIPNTVYPFDTLSKGVRVKTKLGEGVVVGGSVHVKYDTWRQESQPDNATHTHNLDEIKLL